MINSIVVNLFLSSASFSRTLPLTLAAQDLRSQLLARATGRVLEVGVGTGLNLQHYRRAVVSGIDAVDLSPGMLSQVCKDNLNPLVFTPCLLLVRSALLTLYPAL